MMDEAGGLLAVRVCSRCKARCRRAAPREGRGGRLWGGGTLPSSSGPPPPSRAEASKPGEDMREHRRAGSPFHGATSSPGGAPEMALGSWLPRVHCKCGFLGRGCFPW